MVVRPKEFGKKMLDRHDNLLFMQDALFSGRDAAAPPNESIERARQGAARMRLADRSQVGMQICSIDELVPLDHQVRMIWDAVCQMDLSEFMRPIQAREFSEGRPANDVRVMVGLWLWAAVNNVARGRVLARLCETDITYRWMCGGLGMNYHTLNDFRVGHRAALDQLFTATLGRLMHGGLVTIRRITQDGLRVRASAGTGSFHRRPTLEKCLAEAQAHLGDLRKLQDSPDNEGVEEQDNQRQAAAARNRLERVKAALSELTQVEAARAKQSNKKKRERPARASTTDPEARLMKMPNGGFNPAYNVQLASDPISRAIVGVMVSNSGADAPLSEPMRQQVEQRTGGKVSQHLIDGGYMSLDAIDRAPSQEVQLYMPVPEPNKNSIDRFERRERDTDAVAAWRSRMKTQEAKEIYQQRASTSETINADVRTYRGLSPFAVRGIAKATCIALWSALAYNLIHFASRLT
jgi:transposase